MRDGWPTPLVIYGRPGEAGKGADLLRALGKHKTSRAGCIYISKLADIDPAVLTRLNKAGVAAMKQKWPVTAS